MPVSSTIPRSSSASSRTTGGSASSSIVEILCGDRAAGERDEPALAEGVDAEARHSGDFEREVDLVLLAELLQLGLVVEQLVQRVFGVLLAERLGAGVGAERAVHAKQRRRCDLQVEIGAARGPTSSRRLLHVEHALPSARRPRLESATRRTSGDTGDDSEHLSDRRIELRTLARDVAGALRLRPRRGASAPPRGSAASSATGSRSGGCARA